MAKTLVAYFSATGTTARAARRIAQETGADLFEIRPAEPYTAADLDWNDRQSRSSREMENASCRPALAVTPPDLTAYDTIYLGFPIWWYVAPRIIETFVETADLDGKRVIAFATSGGSGMGQTVEKLAALCPQATWVDGGIRK